MNDEKSIYLFMPKVDRKVKLSSSFIEKILKLTGTTRNLKIVNALYELSQRDSN